MPGFGFGFSELRKAIGRQNLRQVFFFFFDLMSRNQQFDYYAHMIEKKEKEKLKRSGW